MTTLESESKKFMIQKMIMDRCAFIRHELSGLEATEWKPNAELKVDTRHRVHPNNLHEFTLVLILDVSLEGTLIFTVEFNQSGLFTLENLSKEEESMTLNVTCAHLIFPYAAEGINNLVVRSGYPPIHLSPIDFAKMHEQRQQREKNRATETINVVHTDATLQ